MPKPGDLVEVRWLDIVSDDTGNYEKAAVLHCLTAGYWRGWRSVKVAGQRVRFCVISSSEHPDDTQREHRTEGWHAFPEGCVLDIRRRV